MSIIKRSILVVFVAIILLTSFILPVSAVDSTYTFNCADPASSGFDGYVVVPIKKSASNIPAILVAWTITPIGIVQNGVGSNLIVYPDLVSHASFYSDSFSIEFSSTDEVNSFLVTWFYMFNGDTAISSCDTLVVAGSSTSIDIDLPFVGMSTSSGASFLTPSFFGGLSSVNTFNGTSSFTYNCLFNSDIAISNQLADIFRYVVAIQSNLVTRLDTANNKLDLIASRSQTIINNFVSLLDKVDYTNEQLDELVLKLAELLEVSYSNLATLEDFVYNYFDTFMYYTFPESMTEIISRLDSLLRQLNKTGDSEQTTVDTSNIDNYVDIEQSLVNNDEAESAIKDFDVSISGRAYSFIWDLVTRIFNSHPEVFGLVIAILTLGFIALLLNR